MSPASTGSVGASAAARTIAAPAERPITAVPNSAASAMNSGMPMTSRRVTVLQARQLSARSSLSPVENSAITTASSVACSISAESASGSTQPMSIDADRDRGDDAQPEVDQRRREGALVLVRERADRGEDGEAEEGQPDAPGVAEVEAGVGGEGQCHARAG